MHAALAVAAAALTAQSAPHLGATYTATPPRLDGKLDEDVWQKAQASEDPATHCTAAGPGGAGQCGNNCEGFCTLATKYCVTPTIASNTYKDMAECMSVCGATPDTTKFVSAVADGPYVACLLWHISEGVTVPTDHCVNDLAQNGTGQGSVTCK